MSSSKHERWAEQVSPSKIQSSSIVKRTLESALANALETKSIMDDTMKDYNKEKSILEAVIENLTDFIQRIEIRNEKEVEHDEGDIIITVNKGRNCRGRPKKNVN